MTKQQELLTMVRNAKNPEKALTTAITLALAMLKTEKGGNNNA